MIEVKRSLCEGHGLCVQTAPEVYGLDDEGYVELLVDDTDVLVSTAAEAGAMVCPVAALSVHR